MQGYELEVMSYINTIDFFKSKTRKKDITRYNIMNMIQRTARMFKWNGLPETITQRNMELLIQTRGLVGFLKFNDKYYALFGSLGGAPNWEYMPSKFICTNPWLNLKDFEYDIYGENKNVVIIPNDTLYRGLLPILSYHSELLTEINLTKRMVMISNRFPTLLTAPDNNTKKDIDDFLSDLEDGKITSIAAKNFMRDIKSFALSEGKANNLMTQILETEQYQKAAMFNDIGLQLNYNMKRETITSSEAQLGEGSLLPLCDDMLYQRQLACQQIKEVFGLDITVEFDSAWVNLRKSIEVEIKKEEMEIKNNDDEEVHSNGQERDNTDNTDSETTPDSEDIETNSDDTKTADDDKDDNKGD